MFRPMRRSKQQLPHEEALAILQEGSTGILALSGDDGYPYLVPLNYLYVEADEPEALGKVFSIPQKQVTRSMRSSAIPKQASA